MATWTVECRECHKELSRHATIEAARRAGEAHLAGHVVTIFYQPRRDEGDGTGSLNERRDPGVSPAAGVRHPGRGR
jgi:hypothetical protein